MALDIFDLKSRQSLAKTSGIVLDRELLLVYQAIESYSTRQNLNKGMAFSPTQERLDALKMNASRFRDVVKDLIDFKLVVQVFEIVYNSDQSRLNLVSYFLTETESLRDTSLSYEIYMERSLNEILRYAREKSVLTRDLAHRIAYNLSSGNPTGFGNQLATLFADSSFLLPPPRNFTKQFQNDLQLKIEEQTEILGNIASNVYYIPEEGADEFYRIFLNEFESKLLPSYRSKNLEFHEKMEELERIESVSEKNLDYMGEWSFVRKIAELCLGYPKMIETHAKQLIHSILKLSILSERKFQKKEKEERDRHILRILKELDGGKDLNSLFLRVNLEDTGEIPRNVIDALRINQEVLHAEWYTNTHKLIVFAMKKIPNLKKINQMIHDEYKNTTEYPLYFRALLEANEKDVYELFQDSEFLRIYGKSLQAVYLRYIPFFYRIFAWIGIASITNAGYSRAKSIIKFKQMDRQFEYQRRNEKAIKERIKNRLEDLAKKELEKYKSYLEQSLCEFYEFEKIIPTAEEISTKFPALVPLMLEKICREFKFTVLENGGFAGGNLILYPRTEPYQDKNREIGYLIQEILAGGGNPSEEMKNRAHLLKKVLP